MILVLRESWYALDGSKESMEEGRLVTIPPGRHEVERIDNPSGDPDTPWIVLAGTFIGATEASWRRWEDPKWNDSQVTIED